MSFRTWVPDSLDKVGNDLLCVTDTVDDPERQDHCLLNHHRHWKSDGYTMLLRRTAKTRHQFARL